MAKYKRSRRNTGDRTGGDNGSGPSAKSIAASSTIKLNATALEAQEISRLVKRVRTEAPDRGTVPPPGQRVTFRSLPLSEATLRGLDAGKFSVMTDVQNACVPHALAGRDVLGAAKTGSGKTLAFLVPMIERLYRLRYVPSDGPGGIVLSPTRELAVQIFEVLRVAGSFHNLSAGLLVGGKKEFGLEQSRVGRTNVLVATPGRLLQHLEQTPDFDVSRVAVLVLDEADRILDMGFRDQMVRILDYLPPGRGSGGGGGVNGEDDGSRQTLLFSATQTKRVADLAALSLDKRSEYLGVHDDPKNGEGNSSIPDALVQSYVVVPLKHKLDAVFSFVKSHLKKKTIVFFSSCSQVRHAWEILCVLRPGVPLMALHGKIRQERRTKIYFEFLAKPSAVLFATDVAARGLDFPNVDWVVSADCPEDREAYIHRVGRTARNHAVGKSLLMLLPSEEEGMMKRFEEANIRVKKLAINPAKAVVVSQRASSIIASKPELNLLAKKAFKSYLRSIHLMPDKEVFPSATVLDVDEYAVSLGLASTPTVRFLKKIKNREEERKKKNVDYRLQQLKDEIKTERLQEKMAKLGKKMGEETVAPGKRKRSKKDENSVEEDESDEEDDDNLLVVKKTHQWSDKEEKENGSKTHVDKGGGDLPDVRLHEVTKSRHSKKIRIESSSSGSNKRIVFDDDGEEEDATVLENRCAEKGDKDERKLADANNEYLRRVRERLRGTEELDRAEQKERIREKHRKRKLKVKDELEGEGGEGAGMGMATLGGGSETDESDDDEGKQSTSDESECEDFESDGDGSDTDGSDDEDSDEGVDESVDIKAQEELALAMLGKD